MRQSQFTVYRHSQIATFPVYKTVCYSITNLRGNTYCNKHTHAHTRASHPADTTLSVRSALRSVGCSPRAPRSISASRARTQDERSRCQVRHFKEKK